MNPVMYRSQKVGGRYPSPSIWGDCPREDLIDLGGGFYFHEDFRGSTVGTQGDGARETALGTPERRLAVGNNFSVLHDADTVTAFKAAELGGYFDLETDGDDNDAWTIFTEPLGIIVPNSGNKLWIEARFEIGDADGDQGFFLGIGEEAAQSLDVIDDNCTDLMDETLTGFRILTGENAIDCIAQKDASAELVIASDVTNLDILDTMLGSGSKASLADNTEIKVGIRFDGKTTIEYYVNGVRIATVQHSTTYYDSSKSMCAIMSLKTGAAAAESVAIDWMRMGYYAP